MKFSAYDSVGLLVNFSVSGSERGSLNVLTVLANQSGMSSFRRIRTTRFACRLRRWILGRQTLDAAFPMDLILVTSRG
jgi:hypothetical protein